MSRRWYLHACDPSRDVWRSFRLDRMQLKRPEGARFVARQPPPATTLEATTDAYYARHRAVVLVSGAVGVVRQRLPERVPVEPVGGDRCRVHATGESPQALAINLLMIDQPFLVEEASRGVLDALKTLGDRITAATRDPASPA